MVPCSVVLFFFPLVTPSCGAFYLDGSVAGGCNLRLIFFTIEALLSFFPLSCQWSFIPIVMHLPCTMTVNAAIVAIYQLDLMPYSGVPITSVTCSAHVTYHKANSLNSLALPIDDKKVYDPVHVLHMASLTWTCV